MKKHLLGQVVVIISIGIALLSAIPAFCGSWQVDRMVGEGETVTSHPSGDRTYDWADLELYTPPLYRYSASWHCIKLDNDTYCEAYGRANGRFTIYLKWVPDGQDDLVPPSECYYFETTATAYWQNGIGTVDASTSGSARMRQGGEYTYTETPLYGSGVLLTRRGECESKLIWKASP